MENAIIEVTHVFCEKFQVQATLRKECRLPLLIPEIPHEGCHNARIEIKI